MKLKHILKVNRIEAFMYSGIWDLKAI